MKNICLRMASFVNYEGRGVEEFMTGANPEIFRGGEGCNFLKDGKIWGFWDFFLKKS